MPSAKAAAHVHLAAASDGAAPAAAVRAAELTALTSLQTAAAAARTEAAICKISECGVVDH